MAKQQGPHFDLILEAVGQILDDAIPVVERAIVTAEGLQGARIAIAVEWKPLEGELELSVTGKTTTPTTKTTAKNRIENGQLVLL